MNPLPFIEQTDFFKNTSKLIRERIASICVPKSARKNETLFLEKQKASSVYLSATAQVQLYKTDKEGKPIVVRVVNPGELFGEVVLFEQDTYPVNAMVVKSGVLFLLGRDQFLNLLKDEKFRNNFICDLMRKLRYMADKIQTLSSLDVEQRFFAFIKEHYGAREEIRIELSKKNIAEAIGTSPETISRMLLRLKKNNTAVWDNKKITLCKGFWKSWIVD